MYANATLPKPMGAYDTPLEHETSPILADLAKKMHFFRFLQKEMSTAKTEAEKEAVFSILMKTKVQIIALKREWQQVQEMEQSLSPDTLPMQELISAHRIQ